MVKERYLSEFLERRVLDREGEFVGKLKDFVVGFQEDFPRVQGCVIQSGNAYLAIPFNEVQYIFKEFVTTKHSVQNVLQAAGEISSSLLVVRDILDKQIIDISGAKVVRVNDVKMVQSDGLLLLVGVDVGFTGILRRFGLEGAAKKIYNFQDSVIPWSHMEPLKTPPSHLRLMLSGKRLSKLHPSDVAHIISRLGKQEREKVFQALDVETAAEALHELEPNLQTKLLLDTHEERVADILEQMPSDEAADVLGDLPEEKAQQILSLMEKRKIEDVKKLLIHDEDTAGGLMTTEFVALSPELTCGEVIEKLRQLSPRTELMYYLYVKDGKGQLMGVLSLRDVIVAESHANIGSIMHTDVVSVPLEASKEAVAELISKYNLLALPVVDEQRNLVGIITVDDIMDLVVPAESRRRRLPF